MAKELTKNTILHNIDREFCSNFLLNGQTYVEYNKLPDAKRSREFIKNNMEELQDTCEIYDFTEKTAQFRLSDEKAREFCLHFLAISMLDSGIVYSRGLTVDFNRCYQFASMVIDTAADTEASKLVLKDSNLFAAFFEVTRRERKAFRRIINGINDSSLRPGDEVTDLIRGGFATTHVFFMFSIADFPTFFRRSLDCLILNANCYKNGYLLLYILPYLQLNRKCIAQLVYNLVGALTEKENQKGPFI